MTHPDRSGSDRCDLADAERRLAHRARIVTAGRRIRGGGRYGSDNIPDRLRDRGVRPCDPARLARGLGHRGSGAALIWQTGLIEGRLHAPRARSVRPDRLAARDRAGPAVDLDAPAELAHRARLPRDQEGAAARLRNRTAGARRRHDRLRRRDLLRQAGLGTAARRAADRVDAGRACLPRRADRRAVRHDQRLADPPRRSRDSRADLGLRQAPWLPRDADLEGARRPRLLAAGAVAHSRQDRVTLGGCLHHRHGAELARPRRTDREIRHRRAEAPLPAAPREGSRGAVLLADRADLGLGCRNHARHRLCDARRPRRQGRARRAAVVGQALHHARPQGDAGRPRVPPVRS